MSKEKTETIIVDDTKYNTTLNRKFKEKPRYVPEDLDKIVTVIPGTIIEILAENGQKVKKDQPVLILQAMKMFNRVTAPKDGVIKKIYVKEGQSVPKNELLFEMKD